MTDILLNGRFLSRAPSGVDRVAIELARRLVSKTSARGWRFDVAVPANAPADDEIGARLGLDKRNDIYRGHAKGYLWEQIELWWVRPNSVLLSLANMGPALRRNQAAMIHDTQVFDTPESYSRPFRLTYRLLLPVLGRRAAHLLTVSQHSALRLAACGLDPARRAVVVHNGVEHLDSVVADATVLVRHNLTPGGFFLAVGNIAPHKNLHFLGRLFAARSAERLPLVIAGGATARIFGETGLAAGPMVRILGRVSDGELKALYENARGFLFPSLTEGFGLPPLEAMRCGCPVIASTGGAVPEVCDTAALACDPRDEAAWQAAIERLEIDDTLCAALASKGRDRAAIFTWDDGAEAVLEAMAK